MTNGKVDNLIPKWIEAKLFENVIKDNVKDYRSIKSFEVKPGCAAGENYATVMLRIDIEVEVNDGTSKPLSFMMKICHDNKIVGELLKIDALFEVEKNMYDHIVPAFEKIYADAGIQVTFGPKSFVLQTEHPYILLENLSLQGFKNTNRLEGLDTEHTESVLQKLAQWHAASAVYADQMGGYEEKYMYGLYRPETKEAMMERRTKSSPLVMSCLKEYSNHELYIRDMETALPEILEKMFKLKVDPNEFNVLNHGDCWSNNIMFQYDPMDKIQRTYLIDFQLCKYGTPAQDLFYFLLSSTNYDNKLSKFDYFIKCYHEHLVKNLKILKYSQKIPTLREVHQMLCKYDIYGPQTAISTMAAVLLDPTENASIANFVGESGEAQTLIKQLFSNARYRKHMEAILPWLQNRGALSY